MANAPVNDFLLVQDLHSNDFDIAQGDQKVHIRLDPASPLSSGPNGLKVTIPADVKVSGVTFDPPSGKLTIALSDGTNYSADLATLAADKFLKDAIYDAASSSLKLTMADGSVMTVPLGDLVKVSTVQAIGGDGTTGNPIKLTIDPASTAGVLTQSAAGLKLALPATTNFLNIDKITGFQSSVNSVTSVVPVPTDTVTTLLGFGTLNTPIQQPLSAALAAATTVSNAIGGTATNPTLTTTVNGVASTAINLPPTTVTTNGQAVQGDGSAAAPIKLAIDPASTAGVATQSAAGLKITLPAIAPYIGGTTPTAKVTVSGQSVTADVIVDPIAGNPLSAGPDGLKVTIPPTPAPTVSNTVAGSGATRTISTTVNGTTGTPVAIPDSDNQTLTLTGQTLAISGGNSVTLPAPPATTNAFTIAKATGATSTVDGVVASQAIPAGIVDVMLGYDAAGKPVYAPLPIANRAITQIGNPNVSPPPWTPAFGDIVSQTADGTRTGRFQAGWVWADTGGGVGAWVMTGQGTNETALVSPAVKTYYTGTTAYVDLFKVAQTPATIAAMGFTAVGGTTATPWALGQYIIGFGITLATPARAQNAANIGAIYTPPTAYVRHEVAITPGVANSYGLKIRSDIFNNTVEVWVCDAAGKPVSRLHGTSNHKYASGDAGNSFGLAPMEENAIWNRQYEWIEFLIPAAAVAANKTGTNTIKLAILRGIASGGSIDIAGFAMSSVGNSMYACTPCFVLNTQANGGLQVSYSGAYGGNPYTPLAGSTNPVTLNSTPAAINSVQGNGVRIAIPAIDRDIYLALIGFGNLYNYECRSVEAQIVHPTGNLLLGRPRPMQVGEMTKQNCASTGLATLGANGWRISAANLAAKAFTPPNSAVSYLDLALANTDTGPQYMWGFVAETV